MCSKDRENMRRVMCTFECPAGVGGMDQYVYLCSKERDKVSQVMCTFQCPATRWYGPMCVESSTIYLPYCGITSWQYFIC